MTRWSTRPSCSLPTIPSSPSSDATNICRFVASPTTLNPIFNVMWQDHHLHTMLYLQLIRRGADMDVEWNPEIVESVEESPDHLTSPST